MKREAVLDPVGARWAAEASAFGPGWQKLMMGVFLVYWHFVDLSGFHFYPLLSGA